MTEPGISKRNVLCLLYNLINVLLLILVLREASIIRGDGPGGFGELAIKVVAAAVSLALFAMGCFESVNACRDGRFFKAAVACILSTALLLFFAAIGIHDACSDSSGYCRNWHLAID